eukprot:10744297-Alexandrium_andersonii.AAC.1
MVGALDLAPSQPGGVVRERRDVLRLGRDRPPAALEVLGLAPIDAQVEVGAVAASHLVPEGMNKPAGRFGHPELVVCNGRGQLVEAARKA